MHEKTRIGADELEVADGRPRLLRGCVWVAVVAIALFILGVGDMIAGAYRPFFLDEPLEEAACNGDLAQVKSLVSRGANIDRADEMDGFTPLMDALGNGHDDVAIYLIKAGANVKVHAKNGETPGFLATSKPKILKMILERGGTVEPRPWAKPAKR